MKENDEKNINIQYITEWKYELTRPPAQTDHFLKMTPWMVRKRNKMKINNMTVIILVG